MSLPIWFLGLAKGLHISRKRASCRWCISAPWLRPGTGPTNAVDQRHWFIWRQIAAPCHMLIWAREQQFAGIERSCLVGLDIE